MLPAKSSAETFTIRSMSVEPWAALIPAESARRWRPDTRADVPRRNWSRGSVRSCR